MSKKAEDLSLVVALDGHTVLARNILGNKGFGINAMRRQGLTVPPAFCITTDVCPRFFAAPADCLDGIWGAIREQMRWLEVETSRTFGYGPRPLLVSVRSGAAQSMPGMMDTVLNLGIDNSVEEALGAAASADFAHDTRNRFVEMYRRIVLGGDDHAAVPDDPWMQLRAAIEAVFASWNSPRALAYRAHHGLDDAAGTAVVVQAMVFGNLGPNSGTGILFSRNPMTGSNEPFGEWLAGAQGEDVVSGSVDVEPIDALRAEQPAVYEQLIDSARTLERLGADVQDIEFTVEEGKLWLLQTRAAKRSAQAAVRLALQLRHEGLIDDAEALRRVTPAHVETLLVPALQPESRLAATLLAKGLPACPGVVSGKVYIDVDEAIDAAEAGEDVILVREVTSPDDVQGMLAARGIVTEIGGATSHAAVVSREIGRPAVVGCGAGLAASLAGKLVTVDGSEGEVREGILQRAAWSETDSPDLVELAEIARLISPIRAHANGDYPALDGTSADAVAAALAAGHTDVVSPHPVITMLNALRLTETGRGWPVSELTVLQAVGLKGRLSQADLAATLGEDPADLATKLTPLIDAGLLVSGNMLRVSPEGRERLNALLAQEHSAIDQDTLATTYDEFRGVNAEFKALISDWQIKDGAPNAHDVEEYDAAVLARLDDVHQRISPIIAAAAGQLPRLNAYADKLSSALERIKAGETTWLARPIIDSYHTVWFELHEELLVASGLTREDEARAGHAS